MPRKKIVNSVKSARHGPKIHLPSGHKIPLAKAASHIAAETTLKLPPAWRVETVPKIFIQPKNANYYRRSHTSALIRRNCWQYLFGGFLRNIFGIYSNSRYWNPEREKAVTELMRDDYLKFKKQRFYGIYFFEVTRPATISGKVWFHGQPRKLNEGMPRRFWIRRGGVICCRINRLEGSGDNKGHVDIEFQPICMFPPKLGVTIISVPWTQFVWLLKDNRIRRINDDGKIFKIRASGSTPPALEGAPPSVRGLPRLPAESLAVSDEGEDFLSDPLPPP